MAYVGNPIDTQNTFQSLVGKRFNGDGSTTDFTLDVAPSSTLDLEVFVGNVRQDPNSAYTVSGTTLSFTGAPPSGTNNIYVVHQAKSVGTIDVPADAVKADNLNSAVLTGQTDIGGAIADADLFLIDDGAGGTLRKTAASRIKTYVGGAALANDANNRVVTADGSGGINGEANLTFDGTQLSVLDTNAGTDNLLVKTTSDNSISMALEKSDFKFDIGLDHNNDGSKNFYIRERSEDGSTTNAVRMEIDSSGAVKINNRMFIDGDFDTSSTTFKLKAEFGGSASEAGISINDKDAATNNPHFVQFRRTNTIIGSISRNGSNDSVNYNTSSDYRLKDGIVDKTDGIEKLKQLKPRKFYWKSNTDKTLVDGFLAHEVTDIVPEAISGTKDAVDEDDNIIPQAIDQSKLVPLLTAALQEAITKIETLEAKVKTLEEG